LECPENGEVTHALLGFVEQFARSKGMEKIVGPMGFTEEDPEGYLIEGFEFPPNLATYYNFEFLPRLLEYEGYVKEVDYVVYKADLAGTISDFYRRAYERAKMNREFKVVEFSSRKQIYPYIRPIFRLMNECFKDIYGYSSLEEKEMDRLANRYLPVVDPRFIKIVENSRGEVIGFILGIPSIAEGIRNAKGKIYPFGFFKILRSMRKSKKLDLYLGGIKESYRGKGVDVLLGYSIIESAKNAGFEYMDSHHELETNVKMRAEMERIGGKVYKRFRIYQKSLI
jgi:predicted GNAT family acetyltransferase